MCKNNLIQSHHHIFYNKPIPHLSRSTIITHQFRPKSLELSNQLVEGKSSAKLNHRQEKQGLERKNVFSLNFVDKEGSNIETNDQVNNNSNNKLVESLSSNHHARDTPSSTTLVTTLTSNNNSPSTTCLESLGSNSTLNSNNFNPNQAEGNKNSAATTTPKQLEMEMNNNNLSAYNLGVAKQIPNNNNTDLMLPTSDYWSTVASDDYYKQNQRQVGMENIPLINTTQPMLVADQEYYLDVANAAASSSANHPAFQPDMMQHLHHQQYQPQFQLRPEPAIQQQTPTALLNDNQIPISPSSFINLTTQPTKPTAPTKITNLLNHQTSHLLNLPAQIDEDYDDYAVPADESCRLDRSQVELIQMIGEGQKGYVFLGKLQSKDGHSIQDVAIKTLKYETEELIDKLMREAAMMRQFEHPHIIKFIGVCPETPALIAMELAEFGEIKQYLKSNKHLIQVSQLILFTFQISTALSYLESKQYVHRDVAARNVLVCSHNCVKLADFGLSRNLSSSFSSLSSSFSLSVVSQQMQQQRNRCSNNSSPNNQAQPLLVDESREKNQYVAASKGKLPVRWLAPESLAFRRFTSASDVWMFAVCSWELFHYGQLRPWAQIRNNQVLMAIESGQRLARPPNCPIRLYQLMLQCWSYAPIQRPKFRELKQSLWSIYLNERAREQLEIEQQELQELQERKQNQERLMLLMNRQQSNRILAEQQQQHRLLEQQRNFQESGNQNQNQQLILQQQQQQQYQQQRINSMSPISPNTASYATGNASGYSSTTGTTAEHSNNSSRSSSMGSLARNKTKLARSSQQRQPPAMLASSSNSSNNFFQFKMTDLNPVTPLISRSPAMINEQQTQYLADEAQRLSAIEEKDERHKKVVGANMRRFQRMPGFVLQKQRSQGSIISDNLKDNINSDLNDNLVAKGNKIGNGKHDWRQSGFDDCALLASSARSKHNRQQLINDLQIRVEDDDDDGDGADLDSSSETETTTAVNVKKVVSNMERMSLASQMRTPEPTYEGLQQVLINRREQKQQRKQVIEARPESCAPASVDTSFNWPIQEDNQRQDDMLATRRHIKQDQSQGKRLRDRSSEPRLNDILQSLKISPMKAKLTCNRQGSIVELSNRAGGEFLVGRQEEVGKSMTSNLGEVAQDRQMREEEQQQQRQQEQQLALHQRLLGHIRPASSCKSSGRRSANLGNQGGLLSSDQLQHQPATKVETVDQSLQILESLITDESSRSAARRSAASSPVNNGQTSKQSRIGGNKNKNAQQIGDNNKATKDNKYKQQQQQQLTSNNMATTHARLLGLATPGNLLPTDTRL